MSSKPRPEKRRRGSPGIKRRFPVVLWILLFAAGLRFCLLLDSRHSPFFAAPIGDSAAYLHQAQATAIGDAAGGQEASFFPAPFYRLILAWSLVKPGMAWALPRVLQVGVGVAIVWLLYGIGRRLFGYPEALATAGLASLYLPHLFVESQLLPASWTILSLSAGLYALSSSVQSGRWRGRVALAGAFLGLAVSGAFMLLVFVPLALGWWMLDAARGSVRPGVVARGAGLFIVPFLAILSLVSPRFPSPSPLPGQAGILFYCGNCEGATGLFSLSQEIMEASQTPEWSTVRLEQELGRDLSPQEASHIWWAKGRSFWRKNPPRALALTLKKSLLFWNGFEAPYTQDLSYERGFVPLMRLPFPGAGWVIPLSVAGLFCCGRMRKAALPVLLVLSQAMAVSLFFVSGMHRLPASPGLLLLAGVALGQVPARLSQGLRAWIRPAGGLLLGLILSLPAPGKKEDFSFLASRYAAAMMEQRRYEDALQVFEKNLLQRPEDPMAMNNLAFAIAEMYSKTGQGDLARAKELAGDGLRRSQGSPFVADTLIWVCLLDMDLETAGTLLAEYLARYSKVYPQLWVRWAYLQMLRGENEAARNVIRDLLKDAPAEVKAEGRKLLGEIMEREKALGSPPGDGEIVPPTPRTEENTE